MLGGQQMVVNEGSEAAYVYCWISAASGSTTHIPYGPVSGVTVPAYSFATLPLNGWYQAENPTTLYVVCRTTGPSNFMTLNGNITAGLL
jgi:hypothetical protein